MKKELKSVYYDSSVLYEISGMLCEHVEELLTDLEVEFRFNHKMFVGCCPVHGGDNPTAWNLYPEGDEIRGYWTCRTHHCEKKTTEDGRLRYGATILGFIKGVLSNRTGKKITHKQSVDYALKFLGYKSIHHIKQPNKEALERKKYISSIKRLTIQPKEQTIGWDREKIRSIISVPSEYYVNRGYSKEVLDKYDVGFYNKLNRVVVPVYDSKHKEICGFLGRSVNEQCDKCSRWHSPDEQCPKTNIEIKNTSKWINSRFDAKNYLYNYWFAIEHIQKTCCAILVEGAGDVWRLEENGIHTSLALFGTSLTEQQRVLLDRSGAMSLIVLLDSDDAGREGALKLKSQLSRQYRMYFPNIKEDAGELNTDEITKEIKPIIDRISN